VGQTHRQVRFFVMVLCYSRLLYVEVPVSQTMAHFLACHQHAFEVFGGIPHKVMVDNRTSAVLKRAVGDAPVLHPTSLDVAPHHGFPIAPCNVGKGNDNGRVENGVGSVNKHVLAGLAIPDCSALNPAARHGLDTVAKVRLPGETHAQPTVLWHPERPALRPVPLQPCDIATGSQVHASRQLRLTVETKRSSVPAQYASHALTLQTSPERRCISLGDQRMARHARRDDRHTDVEAPAHPKPLLEQRKKARDHNVFMCFLALSPRAEAYSLPLEARRLNPHHHVRTLGALSDSDTPEAGARAMEEALVYEAFSSAYSATLVEPRAQCPPAARARHLPRRGALLDVSLAPPALSIDHVHSPPGSHDTEAGPQHG